VLVASILAVAYAADQGPRWLEGSGRIYRRGSHDVKLVFARETPSGDFTSWFNNVVNRRGGVGQYVSHTAGGEFWTPLPEIDHEGDTRLLLGWYDQTASRYGYTAVWTDSRSWYWQTNAGKSGTIPNGSSQDLNWWVDGQEIKIHLHNPKGGSWGPHDIIYSFNVPI